MKLEDLYFTGGLDITTGSVDFTTTTDTTDATNYWWVYPYNDYPYYWQMPTVEKSYKVLRGRNKTILYRVVDDKIEYMVISGEKEITPQFTDDLQDIFKLLR